MSSERRSIRRVLNKKASSKKKEKETFISESINEHSFDMMRLRQLADEVMDKMIDLNLKVTEIQAKVPNSLGPFTLRLPRVLHLLEMEIKRAREEIN